MHHLYTGAASGIMLDVVLPSDPYERLNVLTSVLHEAGLRVRRGAAEVGARTFQEKTNWLLKAMRACRVGDRFGLRSSLGTWRGAMCWL